MANLETLELTISANAESASQGISQLTSSLSSLSSAVSKSAGELMRLNAELKTLKGFGSLKLPDIAKATGARSASRRARAGEYDPLINNNRTAVSNLKQNTQEQIKYWQQYYKNLDAENAKHGRAIAERNAQRREELGWNKDNVRATKQQTDAIKEQVEVKKQQQKVAKETGESVSKESKEMAKSTNEVGKISRSFRNLASTIGRIFKTMLIRSAIRAFIKGAKEGFDNFYKYSQRINGAFASAADKAYSKWGQMKNQIGASLGTALAAVLPILNAIASAALVALNALTALFAFLGGSSTYSQAQEGMDSYAQSVGGAGKAAKDWLATFDELNVMTQAGGGGGGGGGANIAAMFKEMEIPQWMHEWGGVLKAILAGTLGALILPKIFDWIKKIIDLFTGGGATNLLNFLKYLGKDPDKVGLPDIPDSYNNFKFPQQPDYKPFPVQPEYKPFPAAPDYGKAVAEMGGLATAAGAATTAVEALVAALGKIGGALNIATIIKQGLATVGAILASALGASTIEVKVDRKAYDEFKKEYDEWRKKIETKTIKIAYDNDIAFVTQLMMWIAKDDAKTVPIKYENDVAFVTKLMTWISNDETKLVHIKYQNDIASVTQLMLWVAKEETKTVNVLVNVDKRPVNSIDSWVDKKDVKYIELKFIDNAGAYAKLINWVNTVDTKKIKVEIEDNITTNFPDNSNSNGGYAGKIIDYLKKNVTKVWQTLFGGGGIAAELPKATINASQLIDFTGFDKLTAEGRKEFVTAIFNAYGSSAAISAIKSAIPNISVNGLIQMVDYESFTLKEKLRFMNAVIEAFGSSAAAQAAKNAGINIGEMLNQGMSSKEPTIRAEAIKLNRLIAAEIEKPCTIQIEPTNMGVVQRVANSIREAARKIIEMPNVLNITTNPSQISAINSVITGAITATRQVSVTLSSASASSLRNAVSNAVNNISATISATIVIKKVNNNTGIKFTYGGANLTTKADGGVVSSGQLFVARENGIPEMVGSFGSQTAVANNDQIVAGIASGVAAANEEQNALLRQQNQLLMGILQKSGNIQIGASSALGRVVNQSLQMYGAVTGV